MEKERFRVQELHSIMTGHTGESKRTDKQLDQGVLLNRLNELWLKQNQ